MNGIVFIAVVLAQSPITLPAFINPNRGPVTNYYYSTALKQDHESIASNQISDTNAQLTLEWDYAPDELATIDGFRIYYGRTSPPTNFVYVGKTLSVDWPYYPPRTNVLTLFTKAFNVSFTNPTGSGVFRAVLQRSDSALGPWTNISEIPRAIEFKVYQ